MTTTAEIKKTLEEKMEKTRVVRDKIKRRIVEWLNKK